VFWGAGSFMFGKGCMWHLGGLSPSLPSPCPWTCPSVRQSGTSLCAVSMTGAAFGDELWIMAVVLSNHTWNRDLYGISDVTDIKSARHGTVAISCNERLRDSIKGTTPLLSGVPWWTKTRLSQAIGWSECFVTGPPTPSVVTVAGVCRRLSSFVTLAYAT